MGFSGWGWCGEYGQSGSDARGGELDFDREVSGYGVNAPSIQRLQIGLPRLRFFFMKPLYKIFLMVVLVTLAASARQASKSITVDELFTDPNFADSPTTPDYSLNPEAVTINPEPPVTRPIDAEFPHQESIRSDDPESRAWTSAMGWHPGESAVAEPRSHESKLTLFSLSLEKAPKNY
jgi:hypothetical protein